MIRDENEKNEHSTLSDGVFDTYTLVRNMRAPGAAGPLKTRRDGQIAKYDTERGTG